jgi:hypothetical protein
VASPRAVRIPRSVSEPAPRAEEAAARAPVRETIERRPNTAGTQRAVRVALVYLLALALLFLGLVLYDRSAPGGRTPGAEGTLLLFAGVAALVGALGAVVSLSPAPRAVEVTPEHVVVVGRWGRRTVWPRRGEITVRVVRRYPAGGLTPRTVESVEVWSTGRPPKSYLVEEGLFAEDEPGG